MTVITKAIGEKKPADKMEQPLVVDDIPAADPNADPEAQNPPLNRCGYDYWMGRTKDKVFILRRTNVHTRKLRVSALSALLCIAILGMSIGVLGGLWIYREYARDHMHRFRTGWYSIPYEGANKSPIDRDGLLAGSQAYADHLESRGVASGKAIDLAGLDSVSNFFKERFEIDLENEHYEEIDVPDFRGGRQGRFIHDFNNNLTGIIDIDGHCCFVMPLNRQRVLPPKSMYDLLSKMYNGYYEVNTEVVRETMRAMFPPIRDRSSVGAYIGKECKHMPIYRLEKVNYTGIDKRSASDGVYGQFAGENIVEFHIRNFDDVINDK